MRDHLLQVVSGLPADGRRNRAREYLQVYILRLMHEAGANRHLAFIGGTALRLLYQLSRFSEDLDFSQTELFDVDRLFRKLKRDLDLAGYTVTARTSTERTVKNAFLRFEGLPKLIGWSADPRTALTIKVEIDTKPPEGASTETTLVQQFFPIALVHYDLPSLFAGKIHALLARPFEKGRDWFDLVWYITEKRGLAPNLPLLENALRQTKHTNIQPSAWRHAVSERLGELDWDRVLKDLQPFVDRQSDLEQLTPELIQKLL